VSTPEPTEPQSPSVQSFLPSAYALVDPLTGLADLEDALVTGEAPADLVVAPQTPDPVGIAPNFNFDLKRFVPTVVSGTSFTRGTETLKARIVVALSVGRGALAIFDDDFGMEQPFDMLGLPITDPVWADLEDRVRDALTYYDEVADVTDFEIISDPLADSAVVVNFTVVQTDQSTFTIEALNLTP